MMLYFNRGALILCTKLLHLQHCMKNINFHFLAVLSILLISFSCEYSPSEIPLTEVEEPTDPPAISVNLTPEMDTLKLFTTANITYVVDVGVHEIYDFKFLMDGAEISNVYSNAKGSYYTTIPTYSLGDGLHELKIKTFTSTNSGSIADKIGAEQFLYEVSWPVYINKKARDQMKFTNLQVVPDGIKLSWFKYDYADFKQYMVGRSSLIPGYNKELVNTTNPYLTSIVDKTYIEGDYVTYSLMAYMDGFAMDSRSYVEEIKKPKVTINPDRTLGVNWSPSKYSQNVKSYYLKTTIPQFGYPEDHEISDLNQTTVRFSEKLGFGGNYGVQLRYIPKGYEGYYTYDVKGGLTSVALGDSVPAFERGFLIRSENSILTYKEGKFSKFNQLTGLSSTSFPIKPIEYPYQKLIASSVSGNLFGYFEDNLFFVRRTSDWSLLNKLDVGSTNNFNLNGNNISISDDGKVAVIDIYNNLRIFDFKSGEKILENKFENPYAILEAVISPDGKMLVVRLTNYIEQKGLLIGYNIESNKLDEVNRLVRSNPMYESSFTFSPVDRKIIYINYSGMYNYNVDIINAQTFVVENSIKIPEFFVPITYDYSNDRVIAQFQSFPTEKYSYLFDVKTGKQSKIVQFVGREQLIFSNGTVFSGNGRSIKIDDYIIQ